jgi:hypothetical protein
VLGRTAALTSRIRLFTAETTLSLLDPVRAYEDYATLDLHADAGGLTDRQHRESLELFQPDIAPVLRREIPDPPWGSSSPASADIAPVGVQP